MKSLLLGVRLWKVKLKLLLNGNIFIIMCWDEFYRYVFDSDI